MGKTFGDLGFASYEAYLASDHWQEFRQAYRRSSRPKGCAVCDKKPIQLHHHTYERLGQELLEDVTSLCDTHHEEVHKVLHERKWHVGKTARVVAKLRSDKASPLPEVANKELLKLAEEALSLATTPHHRNQIGQWLKSHKVWKTAKNLRLFIASCNKVRLDRQDKKRVPKLPKRKSQKPIQNPDFDQKHAEEKAAAAASLAKWQNSNDGIPLCHRPPPGFVQRILKKRDDSWKLKHLRKKGKNGKKHKKKHAQNGSIHADGHGSVGKATEVPTAPAGHKASG